MTMNEKRLRRLAETLEVPAPDPAARQQALDSGVAEFERAARESSSARQGSANGTRLTRAAHRMWALLTGGSPMKRTHAVAGGLVMAFGCQLRAPHGGIWVVGLISNPILYVAAIAAGTVVSALLVTALKSRESVDDDALEQTLTHAAIG